MVEIQIAYEGKLRTTAIHEPSGTKLITDAPRDNQGEGMSFSPTDLVATALGTCMLTTMGISARTHNYDITGSTVKVQKEMTASPPRKIARLIVQIVVPQPTTEEDQRRIRDAALTCPV